MGLMRLVASTKSAGGQPVRVVSDLNGVGITIKSGKTPLVLGSVSGDVREVERLIERGADVNKLGTNGWTPLMGAAETGTTQDVELGAKGSCSRRALTRTWLTRSGRRRS